MSLLPQTFYHIYNRGNNKQLIFYNKDNYHFFLKKIRKHILPHVEIVAYCLMPNHFHLMVQPRLDFIQVNFSHDLKILLRSYARAVNNQERKTGSLFQQNTKIKPLKTGLNYPFICFHYIHQNPMKAGLVSKMEKWEMSSFRDYMGTGSEILCNKGLAYDLLEIPASPEDFIEQSYAVQILDYRI